MSEHLVGWPLLVAFLLASFALAATPGPGVVYIVTRTIAQGRRAGIASVVGVALGNLGNATGASIGLAALFALSSAAFTVVKLAGAAYLIYLGVKVLLPSNRSVEAARFQEPEFGRIFRQGFLVALLNPKTAVFFAAFLPQFINPAGSAIVQSAPCSCSSRHAPTRLTCSPREWRRRQSAMSESHQPLVGTQAPLFSSGLASSPRRPEPEARNDASRIDGAAASTGMTDGDNFNCWCQRRRISPAPSARGAPRCRSSVDGDAGTQLLQAVEKGVQPSLANHAWWPEG